MATPGPSAAPPEGRSSSGSPACPGAAGLSARLCAFEKLKYSMKIVQPHVFF